MNEDPADKWDGRFAGVNLRITVPLFAYTMVILAELTSTYLGVGAGIMIHLLLLFSLLTYSALLYRESIKIRPHSMRKAWQIEDMSNLMSALILVPFIGVIRYSMPLKIFEPAYWFIVIGIPLAVAIILLIKHMKMELSDIGLVPDISLTQFFIALTGVLFGLSEYMILKPDALINELTPVNLIIPGFVLLVFSGFMEELIFRGVIQTKAEEVIGVNAGLLFASILFMLMHIYAKSMADMVFVFLVGLFYGYIFQKTRNLWGITLSHGITNIVLFLVAPFILS